MFYGNNTDISPARETGPLTGSRKVDWKHSGTAMKGSATQIIPARPEGHTIGGIRAFPQKPEAKNPNSLTILWLPDHIINLGTSLT